MRSGGRRLHVLDLATRPETPLAETAGVDDQAAWLDSDTVAYARPASGDHRHLGRVRRGVWQLTPPGAGCQLTGAAALSRGPGRTL